MLWLDPPCFAQIGQATTASSSDGLYYWFSFEAHKPTVSQKRDAAMSSPPKESNDSLNEFSPTKHDAPNALLIFGVVFLVGFFGFSLFLSKNSPTQVPPVPPKPEPPSYKILETEDFSLAGRRRVSLRVLIEDRDATDEQVRIALLDAAMSHDADAILAFGYWPGDDWRSFYTAGKLEWGKNGGGWASSTTLPVGGSFSPGRRPLDDSRLEASRPGSDAAEVARRPKERYYRDSKGAIISESKTEDKLRQIRSDINSMPDSLKRAFMEGVLRALEEEWARIKLQGPISER